MQIALGNFDEAINTLKGVVNQTEKHSQNWVLIFILMAKPLCNQERLAESKRCLEIAYGILDKKEMDSPLEVAEAYSEDVHAIWEMKEFETAISLLKRTFALRSNLKNST